MKGMKYETKNYNQLTKNEKYCLYLGETFEGAKELNPVHLENGISDLTTSMIKDFGVFDRLLIIGINDQDNGEDNE